jgi:hypothetical protein
MLPALSGEPTPAAETKLIDNSRISRSLWGATSLGLIAVLLTAAWLKPDPSGRGTHQQLGLPPCTFAYLFGQPCPTCGMTTSWAHAMQGEFAAACRANVGGTLLVLVAMVVAVWTLACTIAGRMLFIQRFDRIGLGVGLIVVAVTLADWARRLLAG